MKEGLDKVIEAVEAILPPDLVGRSLLDSQGNFPVHKYNLPPGIDELPLLQPDMPNLDWKAGRGCPRWYRKGQEPSLFRRLYRATGAELGPDIIPSETFDVYRFHKRVHSIGGDPWLGAYLQAHWYEGALNVNGEDFEFNSSMKMIKAVLGQLDLTGGIGRIQASLKLAPSLGQLEFCYPPTDVYQGQEPLAYIDPNASQVDNSITILSILHGDGC